MERMVAKASLPMDMGNQSDASAAVDHPVIRTLYDHLEEVTTLAFHPFEQKLISGSKDYTIKVFDWSRSSAKKAQHTIQEVEWIRCLSLHPSGDWLVGKIVSDSPLLMVFQWARSIQRFDFTIYIRLLVSRRQFNGITTEGQLRRYIIQRKVPVLPSL